MLPDAIFQQLTAASRGLAFWDVVLTAPLPFRSIYAGSISLKAHRLKLRCILTNLLTKTHGVPFPCVDTDEQLVSTAGRSSCHRATNNHSTTSLKLPPANDSTYKGLAVAIWCGRRSLADDKFLRSLHLSLTKPMSPSFRLPTPTSYANDAFTKLALRGWTCLYCLRSSKHT